jgi:uncharacterized membrane protein YGL010W
MKTLAEQMAVYAAYHNDATNKAIHFVFVPLIIWSAMGLLVQLGTFSLGTMAITAAHVVAALLLAYYLSLDFPLGVAMVLLFTVMLVTVLQVQEAMGSQGWMLFLAVFVGSWIAQLVGHAAFEHRKPALADNVLQVFVAPIFVVAEWAFALGLRKPLEREVMAGMVQHLPKPRAEA